MSSTNDTYHHLLVQAQPKSILKKSPSPRFLDSSINSENDHYSNPILPPTEDTKKNDIDKGKTSHKDVCILNDNQSINKDNSTLSSVEMPSTKLIMTSNENSCQYETDSQFMRTIPPADPLSSSPLTSDDERRPPPQQQQRIRMKPKKTYYRALVTTGRLSSSASASDNNDERKAKQSMKESKTTLIRSNKHRQKDMQLDEFIRKYQQQGGIPIPNKEHHDKEQITTKLPINHSRNNYHQSSLTRQQNSYIDKGLMNDDTISLLESIDTITLSSKSVLPLQLLFDVARINQCDRRTKIDRIRQYVEEQIGISAFLTIYKLIKSSQISIDIRQKPFCNYANFIPHLCCLIMLESEQQKNRL